MQRKGRVLNELSYKTGREEERLTWSAGAPLFLLLFFSVFLFFFFCLLSSPVLLFWVWKSPPLYFWSWSSLFTQSSALSPVRSPCFVLCGTSCSGSVSCQLSPVSFFSPSRSSSKLVPPVCISCPVPPRFLLVFPSSLVFPPGILLFVPLFPPAWPFLWLL